MLQYVSISHLCWISCPDVDPRHSKVVVPAGLYYSSLIEREELNDLLKHQSRGMVLQISMFPLEDGMQPLDTQLLVFEKGNPKSGSFHAALLKYQEPTIFQQRISLQKNSLKERCSFLNVE